MRHRRGGEQALALRAGHVVAGRVAGTDRQLVRARVLMAIESAGGLVLVGPNGTVQRLEGDTGALASEVLSFCTSQPRSRDEIRVHVEEVTGAPLGGSTIVDALLDLLIEAGALVAAIIGAPAARTLDREGRTRLLLGMGGAVAAAHAPLTIQALQARGFDVRVLASENALRFVGREAIEALTHHPVSSSMWEHDGGARVPHIELAAWPDAVLLWPATAATLSRIATGDCSELLSAVAITTRAPVLIAPSMNEAMYLSPSVQRNLEQLKEDRFHIVPPAFAVEVALAPEARREMLGGAPGADALARLIEALLRIEGAANAALPHDQASWDAFHRRVPESAHAWFTDGVDPQITRALAAHAGPPALLWDVGTGHGATAIWAAREGYSVVATDVSSTALARARARAGGLRITFVQDDVADSALTTMFDVIVDRGTLHTLSVGRRAAYASQILRSTRPGSIVIVKVHAPFADPRVLSHPMTADEVRALFGAEMRLVSSEAGTFMGTLDPAPESVLTVLERV